MPNKNVDYSFKILEEILMLKKYKNREEVLTTAKKMVDIATNNKDLPQYMKDSYKEALNKINTLTYDEMNEIIGILSSYNED